MDATLFRERKFIYIICFCKNDYKLKIRKGFMFFFLEFRLLTLGYYIRDLLWNCNELLMSLHAEHTAVCFRNISW